VITNAKVILPISTFTIAAIPANAITSDVMLWRNDSGWGLPGGAGGRTGGAEFMNFFSETSSRDAVSDQK
jgi:hypothetical protein